jgi:hypothetical protein
MDFERIGARLLLMAGTLTFLTNNCSRKADEIKQYEKNNFPITEFVRQYTGEDGKRYNEYLEYRRRGTFGLPGSHIYTTIYSVPVESSNPQSKDSSLEKSLNK